MVLWGIRRRVTRLGYVAESCPHCTAIRAMKLSQLRQVRHLLWIPVGPGTPLGFTGACQHCGELCPTHPLRYAAIERSGMRSLNSLIRKTNPRLLADDNEAASAHKRATQLREPLLLASETMLQHCISGSRFDRLTTWAFLITAALPPLVAWALVLLPLPSAIRSFVGEADFFLLLTSFLAFLALLYSEPLRYFRRQLKPEVVKALRPLQPEMGELKACLNALRKYGFPLPRYVSVENLLQETRKS